MVNLQKQKKINKMQGIYKNLGKIALYKTNNIRRYLLNLYYVSVPSKIWKSIDTNSIGDSIYGTNYPSSGIVIYDTDGGFITSVTYSLVITTPGSTHYDASDNYYVGGYDGTIMKFDSGNIPQWTINDFAGSGGSAGASIATDASLNVYIGGRRITGVGGTYSLKKFNSSGSLISTYDSNANVDCVKADSNYVYIFTGSAIRVLSHTFSFVRTITGIAGFPPTFDVDNYGNIYALDSTGKIAKWNSSGTKQWATTFGTIVNAVSQISVNKLTGYSYIPTNVPNVKVISPTGSIVQTLSITPGFAVKYRDGYLYYGDNSVNKINAVY
jgi:hypothetical protein